MKLPISWLKEYVDLTITVPELVDKLTLAGLEVISVKLVGVPVPEGLKCKIDEPGPVWAKDKIVTAKVMEITKVPETDKLKFLKLDLGKGGEPKTVITGAGNVAPGESGQVVVLAYAGAILFDGYSEKKELKELKPKPIRGFASDSMVCSVRELGIADDHEGIVLLPPETPVGAPLVDILGDIVLEIDVLPNMARCLSIVGLAREVAALTGQRLKSPSLAVSQTGKSIEGKVKVEIADPNLSRRYTATLIEGVTIGPSPHWMQRRLSLMGMRPISNIVDITNYMMLKMGQPLHAFDFDKLLVRSKGAAPVITVRNAKPGEKLTTLDNVERKLEPHHLIIADAIGPVALAGVMGGLETEVTDTTKNVLLESAHFNAASVRKTARELNLFSEASTRFSKGLHPELALITGERAAETLRQLAGGTVCQGVIDCYPSPLAATPIKLELAYVERLLGMSIPAADIARILRSLEYQVDGPNGTASFNVVPPVHRVDIQAGAADLVEDIARIYGYDKLPTTMLADELPIQRDNIALQGEERVRDILTSLGMQEVMCYSLTSPEKEAPLGITGAAVELANPIHSERGIMRRSVLASVLQVAASNLRQRPGVRLFEIGQVYLPAEGQPLPLETRRLSIVITGPRTTEHWDSQTAAAAMDFFDLKGIIESLLTRLHVDEIAFNPVQAPELHPGQASEVLCDSINVGTIGQLHPTLNASYELGRRKVFVADLNLDALLAVIPTLHKFKSITTFPPVLEDIALVVDEALPAAKLEAEIRAGGGEMLKRVRLFDVYRGANLPAGKKSLAYALMYQADDRSLTDKEVVKLRSKIVGRVEKLLGATLRA
ncbi:MAG: phenylalanine--tRNA ligase subunit beta [Gemmatales bacterium]